MSGKNEKRVGPGELQVMLGISWPPAHRFINKYGYDKEMVFDDPRRADSWTVSPDVARNVVKAFGKDVGRDQRYKTTPAGAMPSGTRDYFARLLKVAEEDLI